MTDGELDGVIVAIDGVDALALADADGAVECQSTGFDADVPSAVAALCHGQLTELGAMLEIGSVVEWSVATLGMNLYVSARGDGIAIAVGGPSERLAKTAEQLARHLRS